MSAEPVTAVNADEPIVRLRHPWRVVAIVILAAYAAVAVRFMVTSEELRWDLVGGYL